jgi:hypothetical protein
MKSEALTAVGNMSQVWPLLICTLVDRQVLPLRCVSLDSPHRSQGLIAVHRSRDPNLGPLCLYHCLFQPGQ